MSTHRPIALAPGHSCSANAWFTTSTGAAAERDLRGQRHAAHAGDVPYPLGGALEELCGSRAAVRRPLEVDGGHQQVIHNDPRLDRLHVAQAVDEEPRPHEQ